MQIFYIRLVRPGFDLLTRSCANVELGARKFPRPLSPGWKRARKKSACLSFVPEQPKTTKDLERVLDFVLILH